METLVRPQQQTKTPNWWDEDYLFYMAVGHWDSITGPIPTHVSKTLRELVNNISRSKRYRLVSDYYQFYLKIVDQYFSDKGHINYRGKSFQPDVNLGSDILTYCTYILNGLCSNKEKLLVGVKTQQPLWVSIPSSWYSRDNDIEYWRFNNTFGIILLYIMPYLSGDSKQQFYDRLLLPSKSRWPDPNKLTLQILENLETTICEQLGFSTGSISEDEYLQVLSDAFLNQKYVLVEGRPVLVRLEDHPTINQIILIKKENQLIAKIETFTSGDYLHIQSLTEIMVIDHLKLLKSILWDVKYTEIEANNSIATLIASIYRDLVTVEEKEISSRMVAGKKKPDLKTKKLDPLEPKLFTTSWQYIPRRQYVYNRPDDSSYMDREPLSEADQHRQRAIRKWHMVCGHIRRYREKPDWMASGDKQDQALADGVILRTGETYVRPHARNAGALEELGEIDINSIPHYMRRKIAS